ncbi:uncharacterized protein PHA67_008207 [Liasis olivaceus]
MEEDGYFPPTACNPEASDWPLQDKRGRKNHSRRAPPALNLPSLLQRFQPGRGKKGATHPHRPRLPRDAGERERRDVSRRSYLLRLASPSVAVEGAPQVEGGPIRSLSLPPPWPAAIQRMGLSGLGMQRFPPGLAFEKAWQGNSRLKIFPSCPGVFQGSFRRAKAYAMWHLLASDKRETEDERTQC